MHSTVCLPPFHLQVHTSDGHPTTQLVVMMVTKIHVQVGIMLAMAGVLMAGFIRLILGFHFGQIPRGNCNSQFVSFVSVLFAQVLLRVIIAMKITNHIFILSFCSLGNPALRRNCGLSQNSLLVVIIVDQRERGRVNEERDVLVFYSVFFPVVCHSGTTIRTKQGAVRN